MMPSPSASFDHSRVLIRRRKKRPSSRLSKLTNWHRALGRMRLPRGFPAFAMPDWAALFAAWSARARRHLRRTSSRRNLALAIALALGCVFAGEELARAVALGSLTQASATARGPLAPSARAAFRAQAGDCLSDADSAVLRACVVLHANLARQEARGSPAHQREVNDARLAAAQLLTRAPRSGEAWALAAYAQSVGDAQGTSQATLSLIARSYAFAPFLPESGLWRVATAAHAWEQIGSGTRLSVLREALWYGSLDASRLTPIRHALQGTDALIAVNLRLANGPGKGLPLPQTP